MQIETLIDLLFRCHCHHQSLSCAELASVKSRDKRGCRANGRILDHHLPIIIFGSPFGGGKEGRCVYSEPMRLVWVDVGLKAE